MELERYQTVSRWLSRLRSNTARTNLYHLSRFMKWLDESKDEFASKSPDELVAFQKQATTEDRYRILDVVQIYVSSINGRHGYKLKIYSTIRSFFKHNRAELPSDSSFYINGDKPKVVGTLEPDEIRQIVLSSNPTYQAIFLCMLQGGMGREEFNWWNLNGWPQLSKDILKNPEIIRIDLPGRKRMRNIRPYYTFIGHDAIKVIRNWLPHRPPDAVSIFTDQHGNPVSKHAVKQYWDRHLVKLGIVNLRRNGEPGTRYGKNPHEMRDVFRSLWEKSPAKLSVAEYLMGHQVDPLEYNKAFRDEKWTRREYRKALPFLNILSSARPFGQVDEDIVESQARKIHDLDAEVTRLKTNTDYEALRAEVEELIAFKRNLQEFMTSTTIGIQPGYERLFSTESIGRVFKQAERYAKEEAGMSETELMLEKRRRDQELDRRIKQLEREGKVETRED